MLRSLFHSMFSSSAGSPADGSPLAIFLSPSQEGVQLVSTSPLREEDASVLAAAFYERSDVCPFNNGVLCSPDCFPSACSHCGWKPAVARQRLRRIRDRMESPAASSNNQTNIKHS